MIKQEKFMGINECAFGRTADEVYCDIYQKLFIFYDKLPEMGK